MPDLSGRQLGPYRLEAPLGQGGMGEVYRASHARLPNRRAAVKALPPVLARDPDFLRRFDAEANSVAALDHPNILPLWDYGEEDGLPYLAMPLVGGGSLRDLLAARGPLAPAEAEPILRQLAEALDHAHAQGIVHRDVKPANILLREDGRPLLADFGIAKVAEGGMALTGTGIGIGTPEYMAPEQLEGRAGPRSDLYSLGIMLYEMLTGRVPFSGPTPYAIALQQVSAPLPPIRQANPALSPQIGAVVERALAKDPAARFPSGVAFAAAFRDAIGATQPAPGPVDRGRATVPAYPPTLPAAPPPAALVPPPPATLPATPPPPPARRGGPPWPLIAGGTAALLAVCLIAGIAAVIATRGTATPTVAARAPGPTATAPRAPAPTPTATIARPSAVAVASAAPTPSPTATAARSAASAAPGTPAGNWGPTLAPLAGGTRYADPQGRFSLSRPADWTALPASGNIAAAFSGPLGGAATFLTMNVLLEDLSGYQDRSLDAFGQQSAELSEAKLRAEYPDFTLIGRDRVVIGGIPAYRQVYTATIQGLKLQLAQYYFVDPARPVGHIVTFGCLPADYAKQAATFDQIAGSYRPGP